MFSISFCYPFLISYLDYIISCIVPFVKYFLDIIIIKCCTEYMFDPSILHRIKVQMVY
nr:MAG TPA: hypothetical protein [Caudoviricetes sp.]